MQSWFYGFIFVIRANKMDLWLLEAAKNLSDPIKFKLDSQFLKVKFI